MAIRWSFFEFDWGRYRQIEGSLRSACKSGDFSALDLGGEEALTEFDEEAAPEEIGNALVVQLCGVGDSVVFESGLPDLIRRLRKQPECEDAAETLGELISAGLNVHEWFHAEPGLVGMLTEAQTETVARQLASFRENYRPPEPPRGVAGLARLFSTTEPAIDLLYDLMSLIAQAAEHGLGVGVLKEE